MSKDLYVLLGAVKATVAYLETESYPHDDTILAMLKVGLGEDENNGEELMDEDLEDEVF